MVVDVGAEGITPSVPSFCVPHVISIIDITIDAVMDRNAVADFPQLLLVRNSQITCGLLYRLSEAITDK
jgi:hypothetical protein